jgi:hypothetical protein
LNFFVNYYFQIIFKDFKPDPKISHNKRAGTNDLKSVFASERGVFYLISQTTQVFFHAFDDFLMTYLKPFTLRQLIKGLSTELFTPHGLTPLFLGIFTQFKKGSIPL